MIPTYPVGTAGAVFGRTSMLQICQTTCSCSHTVRAESCEIAARTEAPPVQLQQSHNTGPISTAHCILAPRLQPPPPPHTHTHNKTHRSPVVCDCHHSALELPQESLQPGNTLSIKVVGRLQQGNTAATCVTSADMKQGCALVRIVHARPDYSCCMCSTAPKPTPHRMNQTPSAWRV